MLDKTKDKYWMMLAIEQAKHAQSIGEVPVGAVLTMDNKLIAKAYNQSILTNNPTAHAEIQLLKKAGKKLANYRLVDTTLYVTLEPCMMCLGAIIHARIAQVVFASFDKKTGVCGSCCDLSTSKWLNHKILIQGGLLEKECNELLQRFFNKRRQEK